MTENNTPETEEVAYDFPEQTEANGERCPNCGSTLRFDPEKQCLYCDSCGTKHTIEAVQGEERAFSELAAATDATWQAETHAYRCNSCGAEEVLNKGEIALKCPFCGSPAVVEREEMDTLRPNAVIPFSVEKEKATETAKTWAKKKWFAPNDFKKYFEPEKVNGVYIPAFTFDTNTDSNYTGRLGEHYYVTVRGRDGKSSRQRRTRWFSISGRYQEFFDDLAVSATDAIPKKIIKKLLFYDFYNCVEYNESYLYGFSALLYTRSGTECWEEAQANADQKIRRGILSQYHYDVVGSLNVRTSYFNRTYKYLLVPMYTGNYTYKKKPYTFYVNGRTGKLRGFSPVSPFKVGIAVTIGAALAVGAYFLLRFLGVI